MGCGCGGSTAGKTKRTATAPKRAAAAQDGGRRIWNAPKRREPATKTG